MPSNIRREWSASSPVHCTWWPLPARPSWPPVCPLVSFHMGRAAPVHLRMEETLYKVKQWMKENVGCYRVNTPTHNMRSHWLSELCDCPCNPGVSKLVVITSHCTKNSWWSYFINKSHQHGSAIKMYKFLHPSTLAKQTRAVYLKSYISAVFHTHCPL